MEGVTTSDTQKFPLYYLHLEKDKVTHSKIFT